PFVGAFVVQVASSCPLAANGSALAFDFSLVFNKNPLVCYDPDGGTFVPCDWGLLRPVATQVASLLNNDTSWSRRVESRRRACQDLGNHFWSSTALRRTPPQALIVSSPTSDPTAPVLLTCHVWGFYPGEVRVAWLRNGDLLTPEDLPQISATPNGDWTYQTKVNLAVAPETGDTFTCSVEHPSLDQPLLVDWSPGLSSGLTLKVAVATLLMLMGLGVFAVGVRSYWRRSPAPG
ncbi:DMB protein, partial [Todus mexicanus]|nr:DMB protein [Todus mexicanus]